jgi:hypothetical protein
LPELLLGSLRRDRSCIAPIGGTALFDAIDRAISVGKNASDVNDKNTSFVVMVLTDGQEMHSRNTLRVQAFSARSKNLNKTDRWTFAFLMPPKTGAGFAAQYGIPAGNIKEWAPTNAGMVDVMTTNTRSIGNYYSARAGGSSSTNAKGFFTVDAAGITKTMLKKELSDLSKLVTEWTVDKDGENIESFVKRKNHGNFVIGAGFYELRKKELIQVNKQILIKDRTTGKIYGGPEARELLNLPDHNVKVAPGAFGNYDIYVQSTSHNRKLPLSTKLLYRTDITTNMSHTWLTAARP